VKTVLAIALLVTTGLAAVSIWGAVHARRMGGSSSQIFIHGTPVCVTQRGGEIQTAIGECGTLPGGPEREGGGFDSAPHPFGEPNSGLPPGHPPVNNSPDLLGGGARRIPI